MSSTKDVLLKKLVNGESLDFNDKLWLTVLLTSLVRHLLY